MANRPVHLDVSALSPAEYEAYGEFIGEFERESERKGGQMRFAEAASVLRKWFEFDAEREDEIRCFFSQKTQLGGMKLGNALSVLRLLAHGRRSSAPLSPDHIFTQTAPVPRLKDASGAGVSRSTSASKPRSNPFRSHPKPNTDNVDASPFGNDAKDDAAAGPMPSLASAATPFLRNGGTPPARASPSSINTASTHNDYNPFRNRSFSSNAALEQLPPPSMPLSPPATVQSFSPPLPPRPSMQWKAPAAQSEDGEGRQPAPPPPPKHHSVRKESIDEARPMPRLGRSDSSPPTSRPTSVRKASGWSGTSGPKPGKKIQSTTTISSSSSSLGTWIVATDGAAGSAGNTPVLAPKPKLVSSTHLGMDTRLRNSPSPQPGLSDNEDGRYLLKPHRTRSESSVSSRGVGGGGRLTAGAGSGTVGMGIQYETIASSSSPIMGSSSKLPPIPPPASKKPALDSRSQPDVGDKSFDSEEARDNVGAWPPSTGPQQNRVASLGRSKTVGHKAPPPAPPPRRKRPESMQLYNPNSTTLDDLARQPTGENTSADASPPVVRSAPPIASHSRSSSLTASSSGASPLNLRNLKALEGNFAAGAAHLRQDSRNIVKDIQEGWSRRHGKADEREALVEDGVGVGKKKKAGRVSSAAAIKAAGTWRDDVDRRRSSDDDDDGAYARLD